MAAGPEAFVSRGLRLTPARRVRFGVEPINASRIDARRPTRDLSERLITPVTDNHQKMSRPANRWGKDGIFLPTERTTSLSAASSVAIWKPEFPPPTTKTRPSGRSAELR